MTERSVLVNVLLEYGSSYCDSCSFRVLSPTEHTWVPPRFIPKKHMPHKTYNTGSQDVVSKGEMSVVLLGQTAPKLVLQLSLIWFSTLKTVVSGVNPQFLSLRFHFSYIKLVLDILLWCFILHLLTLLGDVTWGHAKCMVLVPFFLMFWHTYFYIYFHLCNIFHTIF